MIDSIFMGLGKCEVCGKETVPLELTVFIYHIPCEDAIHVHHENICHCKDCIPDEPENITIVMKSKDLWQESIFGKYKSKDNRIGGKRNV